MLKVLITTLMVIGLFTAIHAAENITVAPTSTPVTTENRVLPQPTTGNAYKPDPGNPVKKLARGIVNALIGVGEIPIEIARTGETDGLLQAVSYGTLKGIGFFIIREVIGVVDAGTFFSPLPGTIENGERSWGYGPLMVPEWVIE